jgi:hypothetical protein
MTGRQFLNRHKDGIPIQTRLAGVRCVKKNVSPSAEKAP